MPAFIEECRYEWKRLGVPDSMAEEMATELEADLAEAQADGVSAAEMLGESDPRRFAANWACERGSRLRCRRRRRAARGSGSDSQRCWSSVFIGLPALALIGVGSGSVSTVRTDQPVRSLVIPNVIGMKACKAVRIVARSGVDDWRIAGHEHGYTCDLIVVGQTPVGHVIRRHGHPVKVTLRLGRG